MKQDLAQIEKRLQEIRQSLAKEMTQPAKEQLHGVSLPKIDEADQPMEEDRKGSSLNPPAAAPVA